MQLNRNIWLYVIVLKQSVIRFFRFLDLENPKFITINHFIFSFRPPLIWLFYTAFVHKIKIRRAAISNLLRISSAIRLQAISSNAIEPSSLFHFRECGLEWEIRVFSFLIFYTCIQIRKESKTRTTEWGIKS